MPIISPAVLSGGSPTIPSLGTLVAAGAARWPVAGVPPVVTGKHIAVSPVWYDGIPNTAIAILTDVARTNLARMPIEGLAFQVTEFQVGRGGYDPADPTQATVPNPAAVTLDDPIWPSPTTYEAIDSVEYPNNASVAFLCRLEWTEALHGLGEIGLWATITNSPFVPAEVGTRFLFAIAHVPLQVKTINHVYGWRIIVAP